MDLQKIGQIKRFTLINEIADTLRQSIISGDIPPDAHLTEQDVSKQLSVSRGSLREALRILESEGLVVDIPRRGFYVVSLSTRDIEEVYSLRQILEQEALKRVMQKITPLDLDSLQALLDTMNDAARMGDRFEVVKLDVEFHRRLWKIADHKLLIQTLETFIVKISMYLSVQTHLYEDLIAGIADHQLLLSAIHDKDEALALAILSKHIGDALHVVVDYAHKN